MGGDMRCSSEMGGTPDDHQKWGVYTSAAENGGGIGYPPPQGVFCTFPKCNKIKMVYFSLYII